MARELGWGAAEVVARREEWDRLARTLCQQLQLQPDSLSPSQRARVYHYYLPTYLWLLQRLQAHRGPGPLVLGLSAPQGCGKSTLVLSLQALLASEGYPAAALSLDDFYLTGAEQEALAERSANELLRFRGLPGTHDLPLARATLAALASGGGGGGGVPLPCYDKSLRGGRGDRAPAASWPTSPPGLRVVLLEGWSLGFSASGDRAALAAIH